MGGVVSPELSARVHLEGTEVDNLGAHIAQAGGQSFQPCCSVQGPTSLKEWRQFEETWCRHANACILVLGHRLEGWEMGGMVRGYCAGLGPK